VGKAHWPSGSIESQQARPDARERPVHSHSSHPASCGSRCSPTTSPTLSMNCASVESLNASVRWGLSPKARQIRLTIELAEEEGESLTRSELVAALVCRAHIRG
jgi:hypothetical protein